MLRSSTNLLYSTVCFLLSVEYVFISIFSGKSEIILLSVFNLLKTNGLTTCLSLLYPPCALSSPFAKSVNSFVVPRRPIFKKSNNDHKSESLFSIGVPVIAILYLDFNSFTALVRLVLGFLIACASSKTIESHFTFLIHSYFSNIPYDVI